MTRHDRQNDWPDDLTAGLLTEGLAPVAPAVEARQRLMAATRVGRLRRFAAAIGAMLDVSIERASGLLDRAMDPVGWESGRLPGLSTLWVEGGPAVVGCIRGFIRLEAGHTFPPHEHLGDEQVLVLEGIMVDSDGTAYRPGEYLPKDIGSSHAYHAPAGGPDLLTFAVVREGITLGDLVVRHPD